MAMETADVIDRMAGLAPESALAQLRRQRPDVVRYSQGSAEAVLAPAEEGGLGQAERAALALRIALLNGADELARHYRDKLERLDRGGGLARSVALDAPAPAEVRWGTILRHVDRVTRAPGTAAPAHLAELAAQGLSPHDVVSLSQLIAFVNYQVRVVAGLRLLRGQA